MNFVDKDGTTEVYIPVHPWCFLLTFLKRVVKCCNEYNSIISLQNSSDQCTKYTIKIFMGEGRGGGWVGRG